MKYYWSLGRDIADKQYANTYGTGFYKTLSHDLRSEMPEEKGFSQRNLRNMSDFYRTYSQSIEIFSIPWDHQCRIVSKCKKNPDKALFFVRKVIENSWGRDVLLNFLGTDLYERQAS